MGGAARERALDGVALVRDSPVVVYLQNPKEKIWGLLMSLEPGAGALAGFLVLDQALSWVEGTAIGLVVVASAGAALTAGAAPLPVEGPVAAAEEVDTL